jgi:hypothetical protein
MYRLVGVYKTYQAMPTYMLFDKHIHVELAQVASGVA